MRNVFTLQTFQPIRLCITTILTLGSLLLTGCAYTEANGVVSAKEKYTFSTADLNIDLFLKSNGTYFVSMDSRAKVTQETGHWSREAGDFILHPQTNELSIPIRRLRPIHQDAAQSLMPLEPNGATNALMAAMILQQAE